MAYDTTDTRYPNETGMDTNGFISQRKEELGGHSFSVVIDFIIIPVTI